MSNEKQTSNNQQSHAPLADVMPNAVKLRDKLKVKGYGRRIFEVTNKNEQQVRLFGDWSKGDWPIGWNKWVDWTQVEHLA